MRKAIGELGLFSRRPLFDQPLSTSNLYMPQYAACEALFQRALGMERVTVVADLEHRLCEFHSVKHCISVCNGFWALVMCVAILAEADRDEVLMPSLTYRRLADLVSWSGKVPHFCDVDPSSLAISSKSIESEISGRTALVLAPHPIVNCCDVTEIESVCARYDVPLIFDSVESVYEIFQGRRVGGAGLAECFSFHASKLINGFEGGYITTNHDWVADALRQATIGQPNSGAKLTMDLALPPIHAAMAIQGLNEMKANVAHNKEIYDEYVRRLELVEGVSIVEFWEAGRTSYKNILLEVDEQVKISRDLLVTALNADNILARAYYSPPLHQKETSYSTVCGDMAVTEKAAGKYLLMPCGAHTSKQDVRAIIELLKFLVAQGQALEEAWERHYG
jgi:dTDP-4-amino-4,6-dideoxygalactose transaminase